MALTISVSMAIGLYLHFTRISVRILFGEKNMVYVFAGNVKIVEKALSNGIKQKSHTGRERGKTKKEKSRNQNVFAIKAIKRLAKCFIVKELELYIDGNLYRIGKNKCGIYVSPGLKEYYEIRAKLIIYPIKTIVLILTALWETVIEKLRKNQARKEWNRLTEC